jgi:hypothetical protein
MDGFIPNQDPIHLAGGRGRLDFGVAFAFGSTK